MSGVLASACNKPSEFASTSDSNAFLIITPDKGSIYYWDTFLPNAVGFNFSSTTSLAG